MFPPLFAVWRGVRRGSEEPRLRGRGGGHRARRLARSFAAWDAAHLGLSEAGGQQLVHQHPANVQVSDRHLNQRAWL